MQQRLAEKTAAAVAFSRTILTNTAAGLITAGVLGFWSPTFKVEPVRLEMAGALNVDPVSGKILNRIAVEEEPSVAPVRLKPILLDYALPAIAPEPEPEPESGTAPQRTKKLTVKPQTVSKAPRPSASVLESRNMPAAETPAANAAPPPIAESEGWMSKLAPGALSAKFAPVAGQFSGYLSGGAAAAQRAVADRLETIGF